MSKDKPKICSNCGHKRKGDYCDTFGCMCWCLNAEMGQLEQAECIEKLARFLSETGIPGGKKFKGDFKDSWKRISEVSKENHRKWAKEAIKIIKG
jgi:hypothetical protein